MFFFPKECTLLGITYITAAVQLRDFFSVCHRVHILGQQTHFVRLNLVTTMENVHSHHHTN